MWKEVSGDPHLSLELWVPALRKEHHGNVLWDNLGVTATPHGILCNPSNTVASPVAGKSSSLPNFSSPLERADDRKCEPLQQAACHGVGVLEGKLG